jgi:hypothetical protein
MDIKRLSDALRNQIAYPEQMSYVETGILGQGFYPGCRGFSPQKSPIGGLMLLGRDFGTKSYYERLVGLPPRDEDSKTWERTCEIYLPQAPAISLDDLPVWCTNYLMGVRKEEPSTGNVKNRILPDEWLTYEDSCWKFLQKQVLLQRPRLIVIFGMNKQFRAANQVDLFTDHRLGRGRRQTLIHDFASGGKKYTTKVTFTEHPFSLISEIAKVKARLEVKRIKELYNSMKQ